MVALWEAGFWLRDRSQQAGLVIDKIASDDGSLFVAVAGVEVVGTVTARYDGHPGWIYSVAVHPNPSQARNRSTLVSHAERALAGIGCTKIDLQIVPSNEAVAAFYSSHAIPKENRVSMANASMRISQPPNTSANPSGGSGGF